ncbi:MAG: adenosylmethionine-8-amino-7-oxononanoate aminotransferase [Gammaproteobacteria bacterium]|jgi:adenosylmethionine-8-amino-7-oxononanoate aminotransferase
MTKLSLAEQLAIDRDHIWHPYSSMQRKSDSIHVASADHVILKLTDGRELIDGMSSWWCCIHGYNHPVLNEAIHSQVDRMSHVMFGGLTHEPAIALVEKLVAITPDSLQSVFLADSGSVAVEVAMKMAIQYWNSLGLPDKQRFVTIRGGYHGDTFGAMSVCDPVTGMHGLFSSVLTKQYFVDRPKSRFGEACDLQDMASLRAVLEHSNDSIAALILEPIVQGAGGMYFYSAEYLSNARALCDQYDVLLVVDEIATGFGRTGRLFACEHAAISADILCLGKSLTGGYMSMAATIATDTVSQAIDQGNPGVFMHGPTFMGNPLACAVSLASIELLLASDWQNRIAAIEKTLSTLLAPCVELDHVKEVRCLGAIGVIEMKNPVDMALITEQFIDAGVWVRPFGRLVYLMPAYVISEEELTNLCRAVIDVVTNHSGR